MTICHPQKNHISKEIADNDQRNARVHGICGFCTDAIQKRIQDIPSFLEECLPPEVLFDDACLYNQRIFTIIRHILELCGKQVPPSVPRNTRIPLKVAEMLYSFPEDKEQAVQLCKSYNESRNKRTSNPINDNQSQIRAEK